MTPEQVPAEVLVALARWTTPTVVNGLKRLGEHPSAIATMDRRIVRCMAPALGPRVGFAVTRVVSTRRHDRDVDPTRASELNRRAHDELLTVPEPRFLVVQNVGDWQGPVAIWGEIGAATNMASGCVAGVTNGPVRDVSEMEREGFLTFADGPAVGGGFVDLLSIGEPVDVAGLSVAQGDLLHGDQHGVVRIPLRLAADLPDAIAEVERTERAVLDVCRSPSFSPEALAAAWTSTSH